MENTYTDKKDIVNQFKQYFINIGPCWQPQPTLLLSLTISSHSITDLQYLFPIPAVNPVQVKLALSVLDRHKATIDIPDYLISIASSPLSTPLTNLYIESIE